MKYSAVNAKVKGMSAKLLSYEDYLSLCECANTHDMILKLKNYKAYSHISDDGTSLERQLFSSLYDDYIKIKGFINDNAIRKYLEKLLLKGGDLHYYTNLWKAKNKLLKGINKDIATSVTGTEIDMQNIIRIYRLKIYYKPAKEYIYKHILPINYKISSEMIMQMAEADNEVNLLTLIKSTHYGEYFSEEQRIEESFYEAQSLAYKHARKRSQNSIAPVICYIFRKELELRNIISISEGVNYSLKPHDIIRQMPG